MGCKPCPQRESFPHFVGCKKKSGRVKFCGPCWCKTSQFSKGVGIRSDLGYQQIPTELVIDQLMKGALFVIFLVNCREI